MSSFNSAILTRVRRRLGFATVIAGSAFATALVTGNSTAAVVVAVSVVVVGMFIARTGPSDPSRERRTPGEPFSSLYEWTVDSAPDLQAIAIDLSRQLDFQASNDSPNKIVLRGGSQLWLRVIGGYFISPKHLPVEVEIEAVRDVGTDRTSVRFTVRDTFGIAVRDEALEERFAKAAGNVCMVVEAHLE